MSSNTLKTPVDIIGEYIENKKKVYFDELEKRFKLPSEILRRWLVILEEYGVIKTSFEGFKEAITFITNKNRDEKEKEDIIDVNYLKSTFINKAKLRNIPYEEMNKLWKNFIAKYENEIKEIFYNKAKTRGIPKQKVDHAWNLYLKDLREL